MKTRRIFGVYCTKQARAKLQYILSLVQHAREKLVFTSNLFYSKWWGTFCLLWGLFESWFSRKNWNFYARKPATFGVQLASQRKDHFDKKNTLVKIGIRFWKRKKCVFSYYLSCHTRARKWPLVTISHASSSLLMTTCWTRENDAAKQNSLVRTLFFFLSYMA